MTTPRPHSQPDIEDDVADLLRICFDEKTRKCLTWTSWKNGIDITRVGSDTMRFVELVIKQFAPPPVEAPAPQQSCGVQSADDSRWAVNVLIEKIAEKFDQWDTHDIWRSDAAATIRGFKHDLAALSPERAKSEPTTEEIETIMFEVVNQMAMMRSQEAYWWLRKKFGSPTLLSAERATDPLAGDTSSLCQQEVLDARGTLKS